MYVVGDSEDGAQPIFEARERQPDVIG